MRIPARIVNTAASVAALIGCLSFAAPSISVAADADMVKEGKEIAFDRRKGNCLACHQIEGGSLPGNIGPPLIAMAARFPNKADLRAQIADATVKNPNTIMPPFEKHQVLKKEEVDKIVEFIYTL
jgi:sulfur-oxidizing protein SoxX